MSGRKRRKRHRVRGQSWEEVDGSGKPRVVVGVEDGRRTIGKRGGN